MAKSPSSSLDSPPVECGIVMPISAIGECSESHWADVYLIIKEALASENMEAELVSNSDEVTVIQKTIVQNLYNKPIVICDISERNANVMFELGMRLAFDKPTIIIKDNRTPYSFDTGIIEHLEYPRDLRFSQIVEFKKKLASKVLSTLSKQKEDPDYSTFLSHFGQFKVAHIDQKEVPAESFMLEKLETLDRKIDRFISTSHSISHRSNIDLESDRIRIRIENIDHPHIDEISNSIMSSSKVRRIEHHFVDGGCVMYIYTSYLPSADRKRIISQISDILQTHGVAFNIIG